MAYRPRHRATGSTTRGRRRRPDPGRYLVLSVLVSFASVGLLGLRTNGLGLLGTRGTMAIFLLGEMLGLGGIAFAVLSMMAISRGDIVRAAEDRELGRRWGLSGAAFVGGMFLLAAASHLVTPVMTS